MAIQSLSFIRTTYLTYTCDYSMYVLIRFAFWRSKADSASTIYAK